MGITVDLISNRKLAIVRQLYSEASRQRSKRTPFGRLLAVLHYDLAVETALKAAVRALDPRAPLKADLGELVAEADRALTANGLGTVPRSGSIKQVRGVRNAGQHEARMPTAHEEDECHAIARGFLDELLELVWDVRLDSVNLAALVEDSDCRSRLEDAESAYAGGDHKTAVMKASEALEWALLRVRNALVGRGDTWARAILTEDSFGKPRSSRDLTRSIERTQATVVYLALGMDYGEYVAFTQLGGQVFFAVNGHPHHVGMKEDPSQDDAELVISYAAECLVQIEARVGSISKPFGREYWY